MEERILKKRIYKETNTLPLMDEFESKNDAGKKNYDALLLTDVFCIKYYKKLYWVSLIVKRKPKDVECIKSSLTFTDLRKYLLERVFTVQNRKDFKILKALFDEVKNNNLSESDKDMVRYDFSVPVKFNAQNSSNRSGYGNRYCGEELVYEGTQYGETTDYMFTGALIQRWGSK